MLGQRLLEDPIKYSEAWNFGPHSESIVTVGEVAKMVVSSYGKGTMLDKSDECALHEANLLNLDISKAIFKLGWQPKLNITEAIELTVQWYKQYQVADVYKLCAAQIKYYNERNNK